MKIDIRPEASGDMAAIDAVTNAAFKNTQHSDGSEHHVVRALRADGQLAVSMVAARDREVIGHVAISPVVLSDGTASWYGLGPLSVLPEYQGQGIGSALVRAALDALRRQGAAGCVVLGEPGYYGRFGFRAEPRLIYPDVPPQYFQALCFHGSLPQGIAIYHPAFGMADGG
jgi:putative acetyltransferase